MRECVFERESVERVSEVQKGLVLDGDVIEFRE